MNWIPLRGRRAAACLFALSVLGVVASATGAETYKMLVTSASSNAVLRYQMETGTFVDQFIPPVVGGLRSPHRATLGPDGSIYICSGETDEVLRFDAETGASEGTFISAGAGGLSYPQDIVFLNGVAYVSSYNDSSVKRFDGATGAFLGDFCVGSGLWGATGLAFGPGGDLYVASSLSDEVLRFDGTTGQFLSVFVTAGSGGLARPYGVHFSPGGLLVAGINSKNILRYDAASGAFVDQLIGSGDLDGCDPRYFRSGPDGALYVGHFARNEIRRFNQETGELQAIIVASGVGGLNGPYDIVFVLDSGADPCPGDLNDSGVVDGADLSILLGFWGPCGGACLGDLNGSGTVDGADLAVILGGWGQCN